MKNVNTSNERIHPITKLKNKLKYVEDQPWHSERENDNLKISIKEDQKFIKFFMIFVGIVMFMTLYKLFTTQIKLEKSIDENEILIQNNKVLIEDNKKYYKYNKRKTEEAEKFDKTNKELVEHIKKIGENNLDPRKLIGKKGICAEQEYGVIITTEGIVTEYKSDGKEIEVIIGNKASYCLLKDFKLL